MAYCRERDHAADMTSRPLSRNMMHVCVKGVRVCVWVRGHVNHRKGHLYGCPCGEGPGTSGIRRRLRVDDGDEGERESEREREDSGGGQVVR